MKHIALIVSVFFLISCHPIRGFLESEFTLAPESHLPVWIELPHDIKRDDVTIYLQYYTPMFDVNDTVLIVKDGWRTIYKETGTSNNHPKYWAWANKNWPKRAHPGFVNITIDGKTEIIEHKKMEPIFYISNESAVKHTMGSDY